MRLSLFLICGIALSASAADSEYVGAQACSGCHRDIAATQVKTNMARTWHGPATSQLPGGYSQSLKEGGIGYQVSNKVGGYQFDVSIPGRPKISASVETIVGGERHGLSFLYRISEIEGMTLARPALIEGRYLHSAPKGSLLLSPGFP